MGDPSRGALSLDTSHPKRPRRASLEFGLCLWTRRGRVLAQDEVVLLVNDLDCLKNRAIDERPPRKTRVIALPGISDRLAPESVIGMPGISDRVAPEYALEQPLQVVHPPG